MKRVLTAVILIPIVILALFKAPLWLFTLLVMGVALLAAKEFLGIVRRTAFGPFDGLSYLFLACGFLVQASTFVSDGRLFQNVGAAAFVAGMGAARGVARVATCPSRREHAARSSIASSA